MKMKPRVAVIGLLLASLAVRPAVTQDDAKKDDAKKDDTKQTVVASSVLPACPADTTLVVQAPSMSRLIEKLEASPVYKLKDQEEFSAITGELEKKFEDVRNQFRAELDMDLIDVLKTFRGETVFCIGNATLFAKTAKQLSDGAGGGGENGGPKASFDDLPILLVADSQDAFEELQGYLQKFKDYAQKNKAKVESTDFHGGVITTVSDPEAGKDGAGSDGPERLYFGEHGTRLYFSTSKKMLEQTIVNSSEGATDGLASKPLFQTTLRATEGEKSDLYFYADIKQVTDAVGAALGPGLPAMIWGNVKGLLFGNTLNCAGMGAFLDEKSVRQTLFVHNDGHSDGILGWFKGSSFSSSPEKLIPKDVETFSTVGFNAENFGKFVRGMLQTFMAIQGGGEADIDQMVEQSLGMKLDDLLRAFGSRIHTFGTSKAVKDNPLGDQTIVLELENEEPVKRLLETVNLMSNGALEPRKYLDRDVFSVAGLGEDGPAICVTDRKLLVSFKGSSLEKLIRRLGSDDAGLSESDEFKNTVKRVPAGVPAKVDMLGYSNEDYLANSMATVAESMREQAAGSGFTLGGTEEQLFLFLAALGKTFGSSISYGVWKNAGLYYDSTIFYRK